MYMQMRSSKSKHKYSTKMIFIDTFFEHTIDTIWKVLKYDYSSRSKKKDWIH